MIGNVAKEDKLAKNLRAMSRDFSWFPKFFQGKVIITGNPCQRGQLANNTVWWFLFTWSILSCRIISVKPSLLFISSSSWKNIYIILIIFVQCFGAGSVMLWDKESIKLKFVSAAVAGTQSSSASTRTVALAQNFTPSTWIKIQRCICICICKWIQYTSRSRKYLEDWRSFYSGGVSWKSSSLMKPSPPAS